VFYVAGVTLSLGSLGHWADVNSTICGLCVQLFKPSLAQLMSRDTTKQILSWDVIRLCIYYILYITSFMMISYNVKTKPLVLY